MFVDHDWKLRQVQVKKYSLFLLDSADKPHRLSDSILNAAVMLYTELILKGIVRVFNVDKMLDVILKAQW